MFFPKPGLVVGNRYELERSIGRGGMGEVWRAHDRELETPCAVKFILQHLATDRGIRERFSREARAVARLRSPHVVQILGVGEVEDVPYLAMELLSGETLLARLDREGKLDPFVTMKVVEQVGDALESAHQAGIVHRDLKPENIWFWSGNKVFVKVLDFGVAKTGLKTGSLQTATGALVGTPQYMSPEQALGNRDVDHRSDLWSLAVITVECLCGKRPFDSEGLGDLLLKIVSNTPPSLQELAPELPQGLHEWWARALARDPRARFQSAGELIDALRPHLIGNGPFSGLPYSNLPHSGSMPYSGIPRSGALDGGVPYSSELVHSGGRSGHHYQADHHQADHHQGDHGLPPVITDAGGLVGSHLDADSRPQFATEVLPRAEEARASEVHPAQAHAAQAHAFPARGHAAPAHAAPAHAAPAHGGPPRGAAVAARPAVGRAEPGHSGQAHSGQAHSGQAHSGQAHSGQAHSGQGHPQQAHAAGVSPHSTPARSAQLHHGQPHGVQPRSGGAGPHPGSPPSSLQPGSLPPSQQPPSAEGAVASGRSQRPSPGSVGPISSSRRHPARDNRQRNVVIAAALVTIGVVGTAWRMLATSEGGQNSSTSTVAPPAAPPEVDSPQPAAPEQATPPAAAPARVSLEELTGAPPKASPWDSVLGNPRPGEPSTVVGALQPQSRPAPPTPPRAPESSASTEQPAAPPGAVPPRAMPARATPPSAQPAASPAASPATPPAGAGRAAAPAPVPQRKAGISAADVGLSAPSKVNPAQPAAKPAAEGSAAGPGRGGAESESEAERRAKLKRRIGLGSK